MPVRPPNSLRVLCFGDSLTAGYFSFGAQYHPYQEVLEARLAEAFPDVQLTVLEDGMPGDIASQPTFLKRLQSELERPPFDWTIILGGTNDLGFGFEPNRIFDALKKVWDEPLSRGSKVLALTVPETQYNRSQLVTKRNQLNAQIMGYKKAGFHAFDLHAAIPYHGLSEGEQERYWDDGVHMTADGYDWMGGHIADELIRLIHHERDPLASRKARRLAARPEDEVTLDEEVGDPTSIRHGYVVVRKRDLEQ